MKQTFFSLFVFVIICLTIPEPIFGISERHFQVEMISPGYFRIQPNEPGPISTSLVGGSQSQLITLQENGRTCIYATVKPGALLTIKAGSHRLYLKMVDSYNYEIRED
jgi:hypothetical protein